MTTITINRVVLEAALEALLELLPDECDSNCGGYDARDVRQWRATATALRAALAEPVEPVAWIDALKEAFFDGFLSVATYNDTLLNSPEEAWEKYKPPLYTAPPQQEAVVWGVDWGRSSDLSCVSIVKKQADVINK